MSSAFFAASARDALGRRAGSALAAHAAKRGVETDAVRLARTASSGLGLVAARDLHPGDEVLRVPKSAWRHLSAERAAEVLDAAEPALRSRISEVGQDLAGRGLTSARLFEPTLLLATLVLLERETGACPHLGAVEPMPNPVPLFWGEAALRELDVSPAMRFHRVKIDSRRCPLQCALLRQPQFAALRKPGPIRRPPLGTTDPRAFCAAV